MDAQYQVELLDKVKHDLKFFTCGVKELDVYVKERASQDIRRRISAVYVIHKLGRKGIDGYYTLNAYSIKSNEFQKDLINKFPKYPFLPATLIGRFAISKHMQGRNIGKYLLHDALIRSYKLSQKIGSIAVAVDAKNKKARGFYEKYGFKRFLKHPLKLYLPMKTIKNLITA